MERSQGSRPETMAAPPHAAAASGGVLDEDWITALRAEIERIARALLHEERSDRPALEELVNEAYAQLRPERLALEGPDHFLRLMARTMRRVLVDRGRRRAARGAEVPLLDQTALAIEASTGTTLAVLDGFLDRLEDAAPRAAQVFEALRFTSRDLKGVAAALGLQEEAARSLCDRATFWLQFERRTPYTVAMVSAALEDIRGHGERRVQVFRLRHFHGLSFPQIAERVGVCEDTARTDEQTARLLVMKRLKARGDG